MATFTLNFPSAGATFYAMRLEDEDVDRIVSAQPEFWDVIDVGEEVYAICSAELDEVTVTDEDGDDIDYFHLNELEENDVDAEPEQLWKDGIYSFLYNSQDGFFGSVEIEADSFERDKLKILYVRLEDIGYDVQLISKVFYDGEELEIDTEDQSTDSMDVRYMVGKTDEHGQMENVLYDSEEY